jgi:hypothetical protein
MIIITTASLSPHPPLRRNPPFYLPVTQLLPAINLLPVRHPLLAHRLPSSLCCVLLCMLEVVEGGHSLPEVVGGSGCGGKQGVEVAVRPEGGTKV